MKAHALRALYGERLVGRTVCDGDGNVGVVVALEDDEVSFVIDNDLMSGIFVLWDEDVFLVPLHLLDRCAQARWATRVRR